MKISEGKTLNSGHTAMLTMQETNQVENQFTIYSGINSYTMEDSKLTRLKLNKISSQIETNTLGFGKGLERYLLVGLIVVVNILMLKTHYSRKKREVQRTKHLVENRYVP
jgi:hypothetical protein